jgi:hypothetical protein
MRGQDQSRRVSDAMRALGWARPNKSMMVRIDGKLTVGWVKGEQPWKEIQAERTTDGRLAIRCEGEEVPF